MELKGDEMAVEDPMAALEVEDSVYMDPVEVGRKLEERWQRLVARVDALEKKIGQ